MSADYCEQNEYGCDVDYGNLPADYVLVQQVDTADNQSDCTGFTDGTANLTDYQLLQEASSAPFFSCARGVAYVAASAARPLGTTHVVISVG